MDEPRVIIPREKIQRKVEELAAEIRRDYLSKNPLLVGALKGSFVFMSDLVRSLDMPLEIDFVKMSSYGASTQTSGSVRIRHGLGTPVRNRHVLVVEDIIDSGLTLRHLLDYLDRRKPLTVRVCTLFDKPSGRRVEVPIHYAGFTVPGRFVVGYGLDCGERFRYLPDLCVLEEQN